jgi:hypothetical protein
MENLKKKSEELKKEIINVLTKKDLTDKIIYIRDEISNFSGGCIDHEVGGLCTKVFITRHEGKEIDLVDDFNEELGTFELDYFGIDFLLTLLD